jgi:tetratricopeptide (TPR) repeat protein
MDEAAPFERPTGRSVAASEDDNEDVGGVAPYEGRFAEVMAQIAGKNLKEALALALKWREDDPGDALALIALGEAYEALGRKDDAARAYGSIIDLFPSRADLRRFAGARLERIGGSALELAVDTFQQAQAQRPDHPASHRMLAYALLRTGKMEQAFEAILDGLRRNYPPSRFKGVPSILFEDIGLIAAAWIRAEPAKRQAITARLARMNVPLPTRPSLRFVLNWETDANDVDFHIRDGRRGHAFYSQPTLRSGGELYADVTTGYGPECFTIEGTPQAYPYKIQAHYYSRGPMGYGMGKLEIIEHDGRGGLKFEERPFVVMTDRAFVNLGVVKGPLKGASQ